VRVADAAVGAVQAIYRFPVKSMLGEALDRATCAARGIVGDRSFALIDAETQKVVSVKRPKRWGRMFELTAFGEGVGVRVRFPDGAELSVEDPALNERLSEFFGRTVSIASKPPANATFEEVWERELKNDIDPFGLPTRVEDGVEMVDGGQFMSENGNFFNFGAVHLVTTSTTQRLSELRPDTRFDPHRFRPNIVVETSGEGFIENDWTGKRVTIGAVTLFVLTPVPRCVMTTLPQGDLPGDREVLRTITQHNSVDVAGTVAPCVGIYADVVVSGEIKVGDPVTVR
jgi:uncharacterized protein YcbX